MPLTVFIVILINLDFMRGYLDASAIVRSKNDGFDSTSQLFFPESRSSDSTRTDHDASPNERKGEIALVVLTDDKYVLWAQSFLTRWRRHSNITADIYCIDGGVEPDARDLLGNCTWLRAKTYGRPVHYAKLDLFVNELFRSYASVLYVDVDHFVKKPVHLPPLPLTAPVLIQDDKFCKSRVWKKRGRFREFHKNCSSYVEHVLKPASFEEESLCFTTRIMYMDMGQLPDPSILQAKIDTLFAEKVDVASKWWEQGFIQAMFWNETGRLSIPDQTLTHLYHDTCQPDGDGRCVDLYKHLD